jgi:hypothetical protein
VSTKKWRISCVFWRRAVTKVVHNGESFARCTCLNTPPSSIVLVVAREAELAVLMDDTYRVE